LAIVAKLPKNNLFIATRTMYVLSMARRNTEEQNFQNFCSDLSIVVTGPVYSEIDSIRPFPRLTEKLLIQIRRELPRVPIVLSTWHKPKLQEHIKNLEIVLSEDPGPQILGTHVSNLNRQIVSSRNSLCSVQSQYVLRIRTDFYFNNLNNTLKQFARKFYSTQVERTKLGVLDYSKLLFSRPYYICDFLQIGTVDSVKKYWQAPLQSFEEFSTGHRESCTYGIESCPLGMYSEKFAPEQYLGLHYIFGDSIGFPIKSGCQSSLVNFHESFKDFKANFHAFPITSNAFSGRFLEISKKETWIRTNMTRLTRECHPLVSTFICLMIRILKSFYKK